MGGYRIVELYLRTEFKWKLINVKEFLVIWLYSLVFPLSYQEL